MQAITQARNNPLPTLGKIAETANQNKPQSNKNLDFIKRKLPGLISNQAEQLTRIVTLQTCLPGIRLVFARKKTTLAVADQLPPTANNLCKITYDSNSEESNEMILDKLSQLSKQIYHISSCLTNVERWVKKTLHIPLKDSLRDFAKAEPHAQQVNIKNVLLKINPTKSKVKNTQPEKIPETIQEKVSSLYQNQNIILERYISLNSEILALQSEHSGQTTTNIAIPTDSRSQITEAIALENAHPVNIVSASSATLQARIFDPDSQNGLIMQISLLQSRATAYDLRCAMDLLQKAISVNPNDNRLMPIIQSLLPQLGNLIDALIKQASVP